VAPDLKIQFSLSLFLLTSGGARRLKYILEISLSIAHIPRPPLPQEYTVKVKITDRGHIITPHRLGLIIRQENRRENKA
jgi:hypothetical protein